MYGNKMHIIVTPKVCPSHHSTAVPTSTRILMNNTNFTIKPRVASYLIDLAVFSIHQAHENIRFMLMFYGGTFRFALLSSFDVATLKILFTHPLMYFHCTRHNSYYIWRIGSLRRTDIATFLLLNHSDLVYGNYFEHDAVRFYNNVERRIEFYKNHVFNTKKM